MSTPYDDVGGYVPPRYVKPAICSHRWRDERDRDVVPWMMVDGKEYRCLNCGTTLVARMGNMPSERAP